MSDSTVVSVRLDKATKARLDKLAAATRRSKSYLAAEAIEEFLAIQEWQIAGIEKAIESADRGELVPHEEAMAQINAMLAELEPKKQDA
jgi:RHH-type transcriptional regulator, rel operon repressor / antitoxin RelB